MKVLKRAGVAVAAGMLLTACGGGGAADTGAQAEQQTREVEHAMGVAEVPEDPQRVVVLDTGELDDALALGVTPVGAVRVDVSKDYLGYLEGQTEGIEMVGSISEPNLEKIAALEPDLILSSTVRSEAIYGQLEKIAPTVLAPDLGDTWKENFRLYAEALNKEEEAEKLISDFEADAAALGEKIGTGKTLGIVRFLPGQLRVYSDKSFHGTIIEDMGLKVPAPAVGEDTFLEVSPEQVTQADADHLYTSTYGDPAETDQAKVLGGPLWKTLPAVRSGDVHTIDDDLMSGIGIQAAQKSLEVFEQDLG
jgi:iron complex transport system substrate-binding protein